MAQGKVITDQQIETIKSIFAETGSLTDAGRAAGCSLSTAKKYAGSRDEFEQIRTEKRIDIIDKIAEVQIVLLNEMAAERHLQKSSITELGVAFGIISDKRLLLTGQATHRIEFGEIDPGKLTPEEREQARVFREKMMRDRVEVPT